MLFLCHSFSYFLTSNHGRKKRVAAWITACGNANIPIRKSLVFWSVEQPYSLEFYQIRYLVGVTSASILIWQTNSLYHVKWKPKHTVWARSCFKINYFYVLKYTYSCETPQKIAATRVALFDSNVHQIVCRLVLCPRPHWGRLQRSPSDPRTVFRGLLPREERGREGRGGAFGMGLPMY